jgi:redox-sensitive bicupin YhaK (pirin superfamily)
MTIRKIQQVVPGVPASDGAGVKLIRSLGGANHLRADPFLMLDAFSSENPDDYVAGFPSHPHRGFETVTFILDGELAHLDSGGHESVILSGGVQWMTAGRGLVHAEVSPEAFKRDGGPLEILQLWVNLPARLKMTAPSYTGLQASQIPKFATDDRGVTVELIAGEWDGHHGPIRSLTGVTMSVLRFAADSGIAVPAPPGRSVFLYVVRGAVEIGGHNVREFHLATLADDGDEVEIHAMEDSVLLYGHATPCDEPVVAHGPFVMNTAEEIMDAVRDYQAGRFGRMR